jgi:hypothetical protein
LAICAKRRLTLRAALSRIEFDLSLRGTLRVMQWSDESGEARSGSPPLAGPLPCFCEIAFPYPFEHTRRVEPSEEIRRVIDRLVKAIAEGDKESALGRLSDHPGTLIIGSDPAEWWRGHETRAVWGRQLEEFDGSFLVTAGEIDAWEEGTVGGRA